MALAINTTVIFSTVQSSIKLKLSCSFEGRPVTNHTTPQLIIIFFFPYRLDRELNGGAWCPERQISKDVHEHLEVYLPSLHVITAVATQGRFGNGQGREYTEEYLIEYWRPGLPQWRRFANRRGVQVGISQ